MINEDTSKVNIQEPGIAGRVLRDESENPNAGDETMVELEAYNPEETKKLVGEIARTLAPFMSIFLVKGLQGIVQLKGVEKEDMDSTEEEFSRSLLFDIVKRYLYFKENDEYKLEINSGNRDEVLTEFFTYNRPSIMKLINNDWSHVTKDDFDFYKFFIKSFTYKDIEIRSTEDQERYIESAKQNRVTSTASSTNVYDNDVDRERTWLVSRENQRLDIIKQLEDLG